VKAKGKMIAIKGSEYSTSFGDEPGTAGGVKSNTFKKETSWITYSFDVKMDGKNACRHTDKKFHNHKNTADLMGNMDPETPETFKLPIDCNEKKKDGTRKWDECQQKELCKMIEEFNNIPKDEIKVTRPSSSKTIPGNKAGEYFSTDAEYEEHVKRYRKYQNGLTKFKENFAEKVNEKPPDEKWIRDQFYDDCRYEQWKKGDPPKVPPRSPNPPARGSHGMNPDHVHDAGLGGPLADLDGLKWVNYKINSSLGRSLGAAAERGDYKPGDKVEAPKCCN
jgi:hypothetical protein